jgi:hypothetical protein
MLHDGMGEILRLEGLRMPCNQYGQRWVDTGPHAMMFNIGNKFEGYPTTPANPKAPFVMFPNTPYAHLMIPVK